MPKKQVKKAVLGYFFKNYDQKIAFFGGARSPFRFVCHKSTQKGRPFGWRGFESLKQIFLTPSHPLLNPPFVCVSKNLSQFAQAHIKGKSNPRELKRVCSFVNEYTPAYLDDSHFHTYLRYTENFIQWGLTDVLG